MIKPSKISVNYIDYLDDYTSIIRDKFYIMNEYLTQKHSGPPDIVSAVMRYVKKYLGGRTYQSYNQYNMPSRKIVYDIPLGQHSIMDGAALQRGIVELLNNPQQLAKLLTEDHNLDIIIRMIEENVDKKTKSNISIDNQNNGVTHEDYDECVDVLDEFREIGIDILDERQLEDYNEALEIVKQYEG